MGYAEPSAYHHGLALVLNDMTRTTDFIASTKTEEHELICRIDWLFIARR